MSAVNPLPQSETAEQRHEPSMEEILASIRRIIADDQSLPGRLPIRDPEPAAPPAEAARDAPFAASAPAPMAAEPAFVAVPPEPFHPAHLSLARAPSEIGEAHGPISAPQFAMPHGPAGDDPVAEPTAPEVPSAARIEAEPSMAARAFDPAPLPEPEEVPEPTHVDEPAHAESQADVASNAHAAADPAPTPAAPPEAPPLFSTATNSAVSEAFNMLAASRLADNSDELMVLAREMIRPLLRTWIDDNLPSMVERLIRAEIERVARGGR